MTVEAIINIARPAFLGQNSSPGAEHSGACPTLTSFRLPWEDRLASLLAMPDDLVCFGRQSSIALPDLRELCSIIAGQLGLSTRA